MMTEQGLGIMIGAMIVIILFALTAVLVVGVVSIIYDTVTDMMDDIRKREERHD